MTYEPDVPAGAPDPAIHGPGPEGPDEALRELADAWDAEAARYRAAEPVHFRALAEATEHHARELRHRLPLLTAERERARAQAFRDAAELAAMYDTGAQAAGALGVMADIATRPVPLSATDTGEQRR